MEGSERPEKRRKLDEVPDVSETKHGESLQVPASQMTLGEGKRKGPIVLVNKLNVNHDVIERLRRITKMCGKQMASGKAQSQTVETSDAGGSNPAESKKEIANGFHSVGKEEKRPPQDGSTEPSKHSTPSLTPIQNGVIHEETALTESGTHKSENGSNETKLQTAADVNIFREVLKEVIEQRTKIIEEAVAADSIKLQNRIRELERENRELQWNARKLFNAFRQFLITNEKRKRSKISQSVQVNMNSSLGREVPASPVTSVPQTTSVTKPTGLVSLAGRMAQTTSATSSSGLVSTTERIAQTTSVTKPTVLVSTAQRMAQTTSVTNPTGLVSTTERIAQTTSVTKPTVLVSTAERMAQTTSVTNPTGLVSTAERMAKTTFVTNATGLISTAERMAQTTSVKKTAGLVTIAGGMVRSGPSITPRPTSLAINIVTSGSDPGLSPSFQKSAVQQSSVQVTSNVNFHSQTRSTEPLMSTAVVFTVKPRLAEPGVQHDGNKKQIFFQSSNSDATVSKATYVPTRTGQSLETPISKTFQQHRPIEPKSTPSGLPLKAVSPSQTNSRLDDIRQKQQTVLQQRELLRQQEQQQQRIPRTSVSPALKHPTETTTSLLQQLQRRQLLQQQQQHYQRVARQEQKSQVRHLSTPPSQASQQEQHPKQQLETPISSISAMVQQQNQQSTAVESSVLLQEKPQLIRSPIVSTPQQNNHLSNDQGASQGPTYSLVQKQSQPSTASILPTSSITFNATHLNSVLNRIERPLMSSAGKSQISVVPSRQVQGSQSTFLKQTSVSNQRSNLLNSNAIVQDHINKIVNHPYNERLASLGQAIATDMKEIPSSGGQQSATLQLQRHETAIHRSPSSQDIATVQFRKPFPGETFSSRTALATNQRDHSRQPTERSQQQAHVQTPNTRMHPQHEPTGRQTQSTLTNKQSSYVTAGENVSNLEDSLLSKEASSLSSEVASTVRKLEPKIQDKPQSILVPARKKHTNEELLPSGYRFSLPSPEYLLQRQKLQQQSTSQLFQNVSSTERVAVSSGHTREQTRMVYTKQSPEKGMVTTLSQPRFQNSRNAHLPSGHRPSLENLLPNSKQLELQVQQPRQTPQLQSRSNQVQRSQQVNTASVSNEDGNRRINLQSLYRQPIQSPGISSSDPRSEKHSLDTEMTSASTAMASKISNDKRDAGKLLPKPSASIAVMDRGIVLSWNMEHDDADINIDNYELFACQDVTENKEQPIKWKKIGIVKALPLPMACTLTQFSSGSKYFFSVRAVDEQERAGPFSDPCTVALTPS